MGILPYVPLPNQKCLMRKWYKRDQNEEKNGKQYDFKDLLKKRKTIQRYHNNHEYINQV